MGKSGKPLTQAKLARMLKPLGISPGNIGEEKARVRGYKLTQFEEAFSRYLPPEGDSKCTGAQNAANTGTSDISKPHSPGNGRDDFGAIPVPKHRCDHCGSATGITYPYDWPGRPDGIWVHRQCEAPWFDSAGAPLVCDSPDEIARVHIARCEAGDMQAIKDYR